MSQPDVFVTLPTKLSCTVRHPATGDVMHVRNAAGELVSQEFTWREMHMNVLLQDARTSDINHFERAEIAAIARGRPCEVFRVSGALHERFRKLLLDSPAFDADMNHSGGTVKKLHGFFAQQDDVIEWIHAFHDATTKDPRAVEVNGAHASA